MPLFRIKKKETLFYLIIMTLEMIFSIESWLNKSNADVLQQYISSKIDKFRSSEVAVFNVKLT